MFYHHSTRMKEHASIPKRLLKAFPEVPPTGGVASWRSLTKLRTPKRIYKILRSQNKGNLKLEEFSKILALKRLFWTILDKGKIRESVQLERNDVFKNGKAKKVEKVFAKATTR